MSKQPGRRDPRSERVDHAAYRDLLASRLADKLDPDDRRRLDRHLATCLQCRAVDREYRRQRQWLRSLPPVAPPRDMWARTAAALDREVAGRARTTGARSRPGRWALTGTALALVSSVAVLGIMGAYLLPVPRNGAGTATLRPTPFDVPADDLAVVSEQGEGLTITRTQVDEVCPVPAADCTQIQAGTPQKITVGAVKAPSNISVGPTGDKVAVTGEDASGADVIAIVDLPADRSAPTASPPATSPTPTAAAPTPTSIPSPSTSPTGRDTSGSPTPTASASPGALGSPAASTPAVTSDPAATPSASPSVSSSPEPSATASQTPAATPSVSASPTLTPSPTPVATRPTPTSTPSQTALESFRATLPPGTAVPGQAHAILSNVLAAGAAPAWSRDGTTLAFSAMPADRRHGPDVFIWRVGDREAQAITTDHASYFASWAGARIVASRAPLGEGADRSARVEPSTVVIDIATSEVRPVAAQGMWLPIVDPRGRSAIMWRGFVFGSEPVTGVAEGRLLLADWTALDPFVTSDIAATSRAVAAAQQVAARSATQPLADWDVRWSRDGAAFGLWIADEPASAVGRLTVIEIGTTDTGPEERSTLLGPTPAHRAFSLGAERVAWIVPGPGGTRGELRVGTWGTSGSGTVRIETVESTEALPGF
jgi:hypothetical protein